jgi:aminoglycoside phosphotransferase (APT) family kinase protein
VPEITEVQRSTRDIPSLRDAVAEWLSARAGKPVAIDSLEVPGASGMSSETVLVDARWGGEAHRLVVRLAPEPQAVPIFPVYDLERQARVMRDVARWSDVPVPEVLWSEPSDAPMGTPFFVMRRVDGRVPPDVMPYNFGSWLSEATLEEQQLLSDSSIEILARLHAIPDAAGRFAYLDVARPGDTAMARQIADQRAFYDWAREGRTVPLIERTFAWLAEHMPSDEGDPVLCWGDARIGNILYDGFTPAAVLDWEMAALTPPEVDLTWFAYLHRYFQDVAEQYGFAGMPGFLRLDDVATEYERRSGRTPRHLGFFTVYAALRYAIICVRTSSRSIHFGQTPPTDDPDDLILHRSGLEALIANRSPDLD